MVASSFPPTLGGIQTYAHELARAFTASGVQLLVVAPSTRGAREEEHDAYELLRIPSAGDDFALSGILPLSRLLGQRSFDAAFATHWAPAFALQRAASLSRRPLPVFAAIHGKELLHRPFSRFALAQAAYDRVRARSIRGAAGFFPVSRRSAQLLREHGVSSERITVVPNGVDAQRYRPEAVPLLRAELGAGGPLLLTVARLVRRKGIDTVLHSLPAVLARQPRARYVVVGEGPDKERLERLAYELGVARRVRFVEPGRRELVDYYNACDLFVMPARDEPRDVEGFGLVFLEAGACGKPVIAARAGGVMDAVVPDVTGLLVAQDDALELSQAVLALLGDRERAARLGRAARARVLSQCAWSKSAEDILRAMGHTLEGKRRPSVTLTDTAEARVSCAVS